MPIRYIQYNEIDKSKWDHCITNASNGLIYGYSYYLDAMAGNWGALILDDYKAVMPLTWKKKYGFHYLYQPFFAASLGVFGNNITADLLNDFLHAVPGKFKFWDIYLNHGNHFSLPDFKLYERMNYVLPLNKPYEELYSSFRDNIKRNIKKAIQLNCTFRSDISIKEIIALAQQQSEHFSPISDKHYDHFEKLYDYLHSQKKAISYGVYASNNELIASSAFFFSHKRAYYILVGNHPNGRTIGASHALINNFIKDNAGRDLLLDFEGSDIRNIAFFYSSFGATEEKFTGIKLNRLPFWAKWFKK
ncbi:GNAT family N-acetyltransferase [Ferruginibacter albus]|uniref:GNAT family N-acetyltransferase n=1 Tax=Ferruginibacter albus TaxID=2875540 RepID=UPI001CC46075|nr:GNAT family N-acetyltransferase [Ferruginibacter albus]UAY50828.1 hypothetical protein K9M53_09525 [Ferruginibacter albus]